MGVGVFQVEETSATALTTCCLGRECDRILPRLMKLRVAIYCTSAFTETRAIELESLLS